MNLTHEKPMMPYLYPLCHFCLYKLVNVIIRSLYQLTCWSRASLKCNLLSNSEAAILVSFNVTSKECLCKKEGFNHKRH